MMQLSRLRLHPRDPLVIADLQDPTQMHRTVMRGFPAHDGVTPRAAFGVLYRIEPLTSPGSDVTGPVLLVQSAVAPDWSGLPDGYALEVETRDASRVTDVVTDGARFAFRLVAYPSQKISTGPGGAERTSRHSRRVALTTESAHVEWLARKSAQHGFALEPDSLRTVDLGYQGRAGANAVQVRPVLFDGHFMVRDAAAVIEAIRNGIGPGKAYGCGLLSLAAGR